MALAFVLLFATAPALSGDDRNGHDDVVTLWSAIDAAWNARDAERFSALFAEDALMEFYDPDRTLNGRDAIREQFTTQFPTIAPAYAHMSEVNRVRAVVDSVLVVDGTVQVLRHRDEAQDGPELFRSFRVLSLIAYDGGAW